MITIYPLAKGHRLFTIPLLILLLLSILWTAIQPSDISLGLVFVVLIFLIFFVQFFRDPQRFPESDDPTMVVAPADGVLFEIDESDPEYLVFRIRMRFWDVHVNRMPIEGTLQSIRPVKGSVWPLPILPGLNKYSKNRNARKIQIFKTEQGESFKVVQISGTLAYRTVPYGEPNTFFKRGDRIGIIRMGSETDLHLPKRHTHVIAGTGTKVKAGQTILAKFEKDARITENLSLKDNNGAYL